MDYETTFSAILVVRSLDESVLGLAKVLGYEIADRNLIGEPRGMSGKHTWTENRLVFAVREDAKGYVETAVAEVTDRVAALSAPFLDRFRSCHPWLVIRLLDSEFVELHFNQEIVAKLAAAGLAVSVENRT